MALFRAMASLAGKGKAAGKGPKRKKNDKTFMDFDLLYQLSYMSVIAAAGVPRNQIFERASQIPCASAEYFRKVELAHQRLQYDYAKAWHRGGLYQGRGDEGTITPIL